jgi:AraC-like DNA-binding protein
MKMALQTVPENAIEVFETLHHLRVSIHDFQGSLWPFLPPDRFLHAQEPCRMVKLKGREHLCFAFDRERLQHEMAFYPEGTVKICHAGFIEWVVPVFNNGTLVWILFAGIRQAGNDLVISLRQQSGVQESDSLLTVNEAQSNIILEHMRQLAARLKLWVQETKKEAAYSHPTAKTDEFSRRAVLIQFFIAENHTRPIRLVDLSSRLGLSEGRTSHVVRECCGLSFGELLLQARLRTAMGLLRHSEFAVNEVARRSGFEDIRGFHRVFLRENGTTPAKYRKIARA